MKKLFLTLTLWLALPIMSVANEPEWWCGCWGIRSFGSVRILPDRWAIDTDPEGRLNDFAFSQNFCGSDSIIIVWMESSRVEIIENNNGKYYHQMSYSFGIGSEIEEVKKIGK